MALVIHLKKPAMSFFMDGETHTIRSPLLAGPYSRPFYIDPAESTGVLGVVFRPGTARMFFPVAAHELHNTDISLRDLQPAGTDRLLNELSSANDDAARFRAMEAYLNRKLASAAPMHGAVRYAIDQLSTEASATSIEKLQFETGLSHTRFIQLFKEHVGLTPKLFCRVRRFRMTLNRIEQGRPVNWAGLAADCGYFDQAHLIRDFRAFADVTPVEYCRTEAGARVLAALAAS